MEHKSKSVKLALAGAILLIVQTVSAFYDPNLGRWINRDPIGVEGGVNLYTYVKNRPTGANDAWGLVLIDSPVIVHDSLGAIQRFSDKAGGVTWAATDFKGPKAEPGTEHSIYDEKSQTCSYQPKFRLSWTLYIPSVDVYATTGIPALEVSGFKEIVYTGAGYRSAMAHELLHVRIDKYFWAPVLRRFENLFGRIVARPDDPTAADAAENCKMNLGMNEEFKTVLNNWGTVQTQTYAKAAEKNSLLDSIDGAANVAIPGRFLSFQGLFGIRGDDPPVLGPQATWADLFPPPPTPPKQ